MAKKTTPKPAVKEDKKPRTKREGLRKPQVRILTFLAKNKGTFPEHKIAQKASVDRAWLPEALYGRIGDLKEDVKVITECTKSGLEKSKSTGYPNLLQLGYVKGRVIPFEDNLERVWEITPAGRKALAEYQKQES